MSEMLLHEYREGVAWVTLNRPEAMNALSRALNLELMELAWKLADDDALRAVVITGAGDRAFSAGADLRERKGVAADDTGPFVSAISGAIDAVASIPRPTLALVNGVAFGGGLELALACDFRIAADGAELGLTEVKVGIMPGAGGTQRLPRLIGMAAAKEMIMLGRRIDARRARELGLVMQVVPRAELRAAADALLAELAGCAPISVAKAKEAIERGLELPLDDALALERDCYDVTLHTADRDEGLAAFAEKRPPKFQGH
ncbi:MAG TPA: enoyl-CoA hydratase-related protein [Kofleriaceae bacterium]|nr:enoyl-CoA hydratase-related protein [Kofleriaceae bacterium]